MTITFFSNYLNHHVIGICDEMYDHLGDDFKFVCTCRPDPSLMKGGLDYCHLRHYCINAWENDELESIAYKLANNSDVCRFGGDTLRFAYYRAKNNPQGLSFEAGERWLKKGLINMFSPHLIKWWWYYQTRFRKANFFYMCNSAYAAKDLNLLGTYKNRCFKWGYFTAVNANDETAPVIQSEKIRIMWCARFIALKHPELPIKLAERLKKDGYNFTIDMFGEGAELNKTKCLSVKLNVEDVVNFKGSVPNDEILKEMSRHSVFLFTSDKNEGWGTVANEAMSNKCVVVASKEIGSTPYLIEDGETGLMFDSCNLDSLTEKVEQLLENPELIEIIRGKAYQQMMTIWNPKNAINSFLILVDDLFNGRETSIKIGPCSKA